jgi:RNA polymerase sigma factor (sigma-70 family)
MDNEAEETCWSLIHGAAAGEGTCREEFARLYEPIVRVYLGARWKTGGRLQEIDDAVQDVFVDCLRENGALTRYNPEKGPAFRAFLYGVVRNIARRVEQRPRRSKEQQAHASFDAAAEAIDEESLGAVFDRSWARARLREAGALQRKEASAKGAAGRERIDLLGLRFEHGLSIQEVAERWNTEPSRLHHVYATARKEFRRCLTTVVRFHHPAATPEELKQECLHLLELTR